MSTNPHLSTVSHEDNEHEHLAPGPDRTGPDWLWPGLSILSRSYFPVLLKIWHSFIELLVVRCRWLPFSIFLEVTKSFFWGVKMSTAASSARKNQGKEALSSKEVRRGKSIFEAFPTSICTIQAHHKIADSTLHVVRYYLGGNSGGNVMKISVKERGVSQYHEWRLSGALQHL